ncbi:MAG: hypothetical protein ACP5I1_13425, partial [Candidatus Hinthialibacter sp.]
MPRKSSSDEMLYEYLLWEKEEDEQTDLSSSLRDDASLHTISVNVCQKYKALTKITCSAAFYPYSDIKSTIKIERGQ